MLQSQLWMSTGRGGIREKPIQQLLKNLPDAFSSEPLRALRNPSSEPGCSSDEKQSCSDESRDAFIGGRKTFGGDGCRHDSHRAQIHDPENQEDCRQAAAAMDAVKTETQTVS
jgi:hypothetical protein